MLLLGHEKLSEKKSTAKLAIIMSNYSHFVFIKLRPFSLPFLV